MGYLLGSPDSGIPEDVTELRLLIDEQRAHLNDARARSGEHLDALALRLGELQARVLRLDALGKRLIAAGKLDAGEFDFDNPPPIGGPAASVGVQKSTSASQLVSELEGLAHVLEDRENQLDVLDALLLQRNVREQVVPAGRPIVSGWISSAFGKRKDPFSGREEHHDGVDFAGKKGSDVVAVAAGVVSSAVTRSGYGRTVEINHGDGFVTRYGHNQKLLVAVGDVVERGQPIAAMGSSGRSTGPHVHFEVLRNGKTVNPARYLNGSP